MSSILKALQKLEKEKSAKEDRPVRLAWEVMRPDRSQRHRSIGSLVLIVALIGVSLLAIYLLTTRSGEDGDNKRRDESINKSVIGRPSAITTVDKTAKQIPVPQPASVSEEIEKKSINTKQLSPNKSVLTEAKGLTLSLLEHRGGIKSIAVINDLPVMEGTSIEGYRVVAILPDKVLLEKGGSVFFVSGE